MVVVASPGRHPTSFLELIHRQTVVAGGLGVTHDMVAQEYHITSVIVTPNAPGIEGGVLIPEMTMGDKVDVRFPHTPLTVQWVHGQQIIAAEVSMFSSIMNDQNRPSGKKLQEACPMVTVLHPFRLDHNAGLCQPIFKRGNKRGLYAKGFVLAHQISRAAVEGVQLQLVGLGANPRLYRGRQRAHCRTLCPP